MDISSGDGCAATPPDREQVTDILLQLRDGDSSAMDRLYPLVYAELRRLAHYHLQGERPGHTLGTTGFNRSRREAVSAFKPLLRVIR